jgi:uncharacterized protein YeeX (DUF496 family)
MEDFVHAWNHIPDLVTQHLIPFLEGAADAVGDAAEEAADEIADTAQEVARQHAEASEALVAKKTDNAAVIGAYILIPVALIVGAFAAKIIYGVFTKTADKVGDGIKFASSKIQSAISDNGVVLEKKQKQRLLLGEILMRYVVNSLSAAELENALKKQRESERNKRIGEILIENGLVSKSDISRAVKIQERAK